MSNGLICPTDASTIQARIRNCYAGFEKRDGVKTSVPLIDHQSKKRVWWMDFAFFPQGSAGGEDVSMIVKCLSDITPIELASGEQPLVELVGPYVEISPRGVSLVIEGVQRVKAAK